MAKNKSVLVPAAYYHLFNQGVGNEKLFKIEENYFYFLGLFRKYILPIAEVFSFCLVPNHFEFFICIRNENVICLHMKKLRSPYLDFEDTVHLFLLQQFSNFLNAYAKAFNKQQNRKGRLFIEPFKRNILSAPGYFSNLVFDMHLLPVHLGLCLNAKEWPFSSYQIISHDKKGWLQSKTVLGWFGSIQAFRQNHDLPPDRNLYNHTTIESLKSRGFNSMRSPISNSDDVTLTWSQDSQGIF